MAQLLQRACHPFLRRIFADAEGSGGFAMAPLIEESKQQRIAISLAKAFERFINGRGNPLPRVVRGGELLHGHSLLFASLTALLRADGTTGNKTGGAEQPAGENNVLAEPARLASQQNEHRLRHVFRQLRVADLSECHGEHQIGVTVDQCAEGCFRLPLNVVLQ